jgi:hypothetical protein
MYTCAGGLYLMVALAGEFHNFKEIEVGFRLLMAASLQKRVLGSF